VGDIHSLAWVDRPDISYLAACGPGGVALWKVSRRSPIRMEQVLKLPRKWCLSTALNAEGSLLVWTEEDWRLKAWDVAGAREKLLHAPPMFSGWHGLAFLPDDKSIIYISKSGVAEIWNVAEDRRVDSLGEPGIFNAPHISLSPDGKWLAALTQPDTVTIWHMPARKHVFSLRPEHGTVWSLAWDPSSEHLAVGQSDGGLAIWHVPRIQRSLAECGLEWRGESADGALSRSGF
jgi:WD40 repeat protein